MDVPLDKRECAPHDMAPQRRVVVDVFSQVYTARASSTYLAASPASSLLDTDCLGMRLWLTFNAIDMSFDLLGSGLDGHGQVP